MGDIRSKCGKSSRCRKKLTNKLNTSQKGVVGEYIEIANLTKQGYWVAKAVDPACPFDLVAVDKKGNVQLLDIKTNTYRKKAKKKTWSKRICRSPTKLQKELNIKYIMVDHGN